MRLLKKAERQEKREYYYRQWLMLLPHMTEETYVTFDDYYTERQEPQIDLRSKEEIMKDIYGVKTSKK